MIHRNMKDMLQGRIDAAEARMNQATDAYELAANRATTACDVMQDATDEFQRLRRLADPDLDRKPR